MAPGPMHFDRDPLGYERGRPPYPDALWAHLRRIGALRPGSRALELGAGTGQATGPLLDAGLRVTAVEPGPALAARLRERYPAAEVLVATAEDAEVPDVAFDLAVAATSLHWMDLGVVLPKLHRALRPDGRFLVWSTQYGDAAFSSGFRDRVEAIVARRAAPAETGQRAFTPEDWTRALTAEGLFSLDSTEEFAWEIDLDDARIRALFGSFSNWTPEEADEAAAAVRELGGVVRERYRTHLTVLSARRAEPHRRG